MLDNGHEKNIVPLEKPYEGLYIPHNMWREMYDFTPDAVLVVLASEVYREEDYIRDYDEFLRFVSEEEQKHGGHARRSKSTAAMREGEARNEASPVLPQGCPADA